MQEEEISSLQDDIVSPDNITHRSSDQASHHEPQSEKNFQHQASSFFGSSINGNGGSGGETLIETSMTQISSAGCDSQSMGFTPMGVISKTQKSCCSVMEYQQPQACPKEELSTQIKTMDELMALVRRMGQKKIVIDGKVFELDFEEMPPLQSMADLKIEPQAKSNGSEATQESFIETPQPPQVPSLAVPMGGFNFGSMMNSLQPTNFLNSGRLPPLSLPPPPCLPDFSNLPPMTGGFNFAMMQQQLILPQANPVPPPMLTPIPTQNVLRPSGRDEKQLQEASTSREPKAEQTPSAVSLKKSNSVMTEMFNQKLIIDESQILRGLTSGKNNNNTSFYGLRKRTEELEKVLSKQEKEIQELKKVKKELSDFVIQHFSQKSITQSIQDQGLLEILAKAQMQNAKVHLAFLFSSPLVKISAKDKQIDMPQIDYNKEFAGMLEGLNKTGMNITYLKTQATAQKLAETLNEGPIAIHFSGHGIKESNNQINTVRGNGVSGYLVFEDQSGQAQLLSDTLLKNILNSQGIKPEFVFVASCHSQFAGNIFHQAGAKHVICIQQNEKISDEASICFSQAFYKALYNQNRTVCQAFDIAKSLLQSHPDKSISSEAFKFLILKSKEEEDHGDEFDVRNYGNPLMIGFQNGKPAKKEHKCRIFGPFKEGKATNAQESSLPMFRIETSKAEDFIGRNIEMHHVIQCVIEKRVVNVMGIPGIGKTTLVKAVAHYMDERQQFRDGIIILSLRNLDQVSMIVTRLELIIKKKLKEEGTPAADDKIVMERIVDFLADKELLLIMDNAETPSKKDCKNFTELIKNLLENCPQVRFLFTSRYNIGSFENNSEQVIELKELHMKYAVELLKRKASRKIDQSEIEELLKIKPDKVLHSNPLKKEVQGGLESHHMFEILKGHPHAISLAAPLLQNKKLKELYELLNSDEIMNWLENQGIKDDPMGSLKVSMDISIKQLSEAEPQAIKLFWLIGLLPGGCTKEDLDKLWGDGWLSLIEKLLRSSLLVKKSVADENIYQLFPFMNQYAATNMNHDEKITMHGKITRHYMETCRGLIKEQLDCKTTKLISIETNIWACIYRMRDNRQTPDDNSTEKRAKSPKLSVISQRITTTPMSTINKTSHGTMSNKSDGVEIISTKSKGNAKSEGIHPRHNTTTHSVVDSSNKYTHIISSSNDDDQDSSSNSHEECPKSSTGQVLTVNDISEDMSDTHYGDKYDSILSQRINYGLNKVRSKSEKVPNQVLHPQLISMVSRCGLQEQDEQGASIARGSQRNDCTTKYHKQNGKPESN